MNVLHFMINGAFIWVMTLPQLLYFRGRFVYASPVPVSRVSFTKSFLSHVLAEERLPSPLIDQRSRLSWAFFEVSTTPIDSRIASFYILSLRFPPSSTSSSASLPHAVPFLVIPSSVRSHDLSYGRVF